MSTNPGPLLMNFPNVRLELKIQVSRRSRNVHVLYQLCDREIPSSSPPSTTFKKDGFTHNKRNLTDFEEKKRVNITLEEQRAAKEKQLYPIEEIKVCGRLIGAVQNQIDFQSRGVQIRD